MSPPHVEPSGRARLPLNALRAFEASARHLNFTRAALELCVSQGAVSHQVAGLERRLGVQLFRRLPRGLALTAEGEALAPVLTESFERIGATLERCAGSQPREILTVGVVGTFAAHWLLPRLAGFRRALPHIDLRLMTNNNRVELANEGLDLAIRYGDGAWRGVHAEPIMDAPLTPLCAPQIAERLSSPSSLAGQTLLRSYRSDEWPAWFATAGCDCPRLDGPVLDSTALMAAAAEQGAGVALAPPVMFSRAIAAGRLSRPFQEEIAPGRYWLTRLQSRDPVPAGLAFREWLIAEAAAGD